MKILMYSSLHVQFAVFICTFDIINSLGVAFGPIFLGFELTQHTCYKFHTATNRYALDQNKHAILCTKGLEIFKIDV